MNIMNEAYIPTLYYTHIETVGNQTEADLISNVVSLGFNVQRVCVWTALPLSSARIQSFAIEHASQTAVRLITPAKAD